MHEIFTLMKEHTPQIIFVSVFIEQIGLPIPAVPVLIIAGALASTGNGLFIVIITAIFAALSADLLWYLVGKRYGFKILRKLCSISLAPDYCVRQTEGVFSRFGYLALIGSKFLPGFSTVAPPLAGVTGISLFPFVLFDGLGSLIWIVITVGIGRIFKSGIDVVLVNLVHAGSIAGFFIFIFFILYLMVKWWERRRFYKTLEMARISVDELLALMQQGHPPLILDVRNRTSTNDGHIPGAIVASLDGLDPFLENLPRNEDIVVYCNCPNEVSSAMLARTLMGRGFQKVHPLKGGLDAWIDAGLAVEHGEILQDSQV